MTNHTELLVIGAGPYAYSAAAYARDRGIETRIVGRPMSLWREQMPTDMLLRSGPDWHLDGSEQDTFAAYFEDRGLDPRSHDPIPIAVFLDYTDWFADRKSLDVEERLVASLTHANGSFAARMEDGTTLTAEKVLAAPGIAYFTNLPDWWAEVPESRRSHTSELVDFDSLAGARVAVIGGRQSAYEWAALLTDHGAARVDVVHRHDPPVSSGLVGRSSTTTSSSARPAAAGGAGCPARGSRRSLCASGRSGGSRWNGGCSRGSRTTWCTDIPGPRSRAARRPTTRSRWRCRTGRRWRSTTWSSPPATGPS